MNYSLSSYSMFSIWEVCTLRLKKKPKKEKYLLWVSHKRRLNYTYSSGTYVHCSLEVISCALSQFG